MSGGFEGGVASICAHKCSPNPGNLKPSSMHGVVLTHAWDLSGSPSSLGEVKRELGSADDQTGALRLRFGCEKTEIDDRWVEK